MRLTNCRLCSSPRIGPVVDLGFHPLADTFLTAEVLFTEETSYPLQLALCDDCGHVFTLVTVSPEDRYQKHEYSYDSSNSKVAIEHFREMAADVVALYGLGPSSVVADIGSNVGTLLGHVRDLAGSTVVGIEPSRNIAALARQAGVPTVNDFFAERALPAILEHGPLDALLSANVINHVDDLPTLWGDVKRVLKPGGVFVFEVPYLYELVRRTAFDTIYHEHVHYHSLAPLIRSLATAGFVVTHVDELEYMCGSIRVHTRLSGSSDPKVGALVEREARFGLRERSTYAAFMNRVQKVKFSVVSHLAAIRASGGKVVGIGAATKGNTLLNYCGLDSDYLAYVTDSSALKIGKYTPGSHIPIIDDADIGKDVTLALILPWNLADFLKKKLAHLGVDFYVPQVEVLAPIEHRQE